MAIASASDANHVRYGALFLLLPGTYCEAPPLATWVPNNAAPHVSRATATALLTVMTNSGAILATWLLGSLSAPPGYTSATITLLVFHVGIFVCAVANVLYLVAKNQGKRVIRNGVGDRSEEMLASGDESPWFEYKL